MARLYNRPDIVTEAQEYQYRLLKYYIEHYRAQKYRPCSGYVQFMFIDLSPQSFYGIYDWWGMPKHSLDALMESNQPVVGMIEQTAKGTEAVWLINDSHRNLGNVTVSWTVTGADGTLIAEGAESVVCGPDSAHQVAALSISASGQPGMVHAAVVVRGEGGEVVTTNRYRDMFNHPPHVKGHPTRMSHEYGVRLYTA
jgi:beta-mannosidase